MAMPSRTPASNPAHPPSSRLSVPPTASGTFSPTKPGTAGTGTLILEETRAARATAQHAVDILVEMQTPGEAEAGPLDDVKALLEAICSKLATLDDRLSAIEHRLPALRPRLVP